MARTEHGTLTAGVVETVTVDDAMASDTLGVVVVAVIDPTAEAWYRLDGQDPVAGAAGAYRLWSNEPAAGHRAGSEEVTVKLLSTAADAFSVMVY